MNQKDMKILSHLREDARMSLTKMSRNTHIPVSTIFDRIKSYEKNVIIRHATLLNFQKLGYNARVNISLKVNREERDKIKDYLVNSQFVNTLYKINNGFDFMIEGIFRNLLEMEDFIENLENKFQIVEHKSHFIIDDIKREGFLSNTLIV
ncbi:MAG: Lrp/AsnC family transcriptional regulator [bacterium]